MKLLVLGGTKFLGRHIITTALDRGHDVTMFNRGQLAPEIFPQIESLIGDRNTDLKPLTNRRWDAVVDTCGYTPSAVTASARLLADSVDHYAFISSLSVYKNFANPSPDETCPVGVISETELAQIEQSIPASGGIPAQAYGAAYGPLKALCEIAAESAMPGRVLNVRAGLIVGPHDYTDRFTYWVQRMADGGEVLAPAPSDQLVQLVDARDLARWIVEMAERRLSGTFNATGPDYPLTFDGMLDQCADSHEVRVTWVDEDFLLQNGVAPWTDLPLWLPDTPDNEDDVGTNKYFFEVNCQKAIDAGLTFRPLKETAHDTLEWHNKRANIDLRAGLTRQREAEILDRINRISRD